MALSPIPELCMWWLHRETQQIHKVLITGYYPDALLWEIEFVDAQGKRWRVCDYYWNLFSRQEDAAVAKQNLINKVQRCDPI